MNQPSVVIVSDDPEFSGAISSRWQQERGEPTFTLVSGDLCQDLAEDAFDLAIVGNVRTDLPKLLKTLDVTGKPVLLLADESSLEAQKNPRLTILRRHEGWVDTLVLLGSEILRRSDALSRLCRAEHSNVILERQAALGRYIIDMRHNLNNALTSILGNSELLLMGADGLQNHSQSQVETIRNMAIRMNEVMKRFSSLEKELNAVARQSEEPKVKTQAAAAW